VRRLLLARLRQAELRLADAEYHLHKWGFANTPSQDDCAKRRIQKLKRKVERLQARAASEGDA
jgi:hypothetical protein